MAAELPAGQATAAGWRSVSSDAGPKQYSALRLEHHHPSTDASRPEGHRHLLAESKVVFGGNPGGLYPHSDSWIRGKYPGAGTDTARGASSPPLCVPLDVRAFIRASRGSSPAWSIQELVRGFKGLRTRVGFEFRLYL